MATEARALVEEPNPEGRETRLLDFLRERLAAQLEMDPRELATDEPLVELGADSLVLVNSIRQIERSFGVRLKVRQFFEELDTLEALARHLAKEAPQAPSPEQTPVVATELAREEPGTAAAPTPGLTRESPRKAPLPPNAAPAQGKGLPSGAEGQLGAVLREQLQLVSRVIGAQIETLGGGAPSAPGYPAAAKSPPTAPGAEATSQALGTAAPAPEPAAPSPTDAAPDADPAPTADGAPAATPGGAAEAAPEAAPVDLVSPWARRRGRPEGVRPEGPVPGATSPRASCAERTARLQDALLRRAAEEPEAWAIDEGGGAIRRGALAERARGIGRALRAHGAGPGVRVGLLADRLEGSVAGAVAILEAGATCVLLREAEGTAAALDLVLASPGRWAAAERVARIVVPLDADSGEPPTDAAPPASEGEAARASAREALAGPEGTVLNHEEALAALRALDAEPGCRPGEVLRVDRPPATPFAMLTTLWALGRGGRLALVDPEGCPSRLPPASPLPIGLSFFGIYAPRGTALRYRELLDATRRADAAGLECVWVPERHFHEFGGIFPSPSVLCGALARETSRVGLRAGSVVLPLQHPIRVAEEWSVVDNLSDGRVGLGVAPGWHPRDFAFAPETYERRRDVLLERLDVVRRLWRGDEVSVSAPDGQRFDVTLHPLPVQGELPVWMTSVSSPETWRWAGELGAGVLTNLMRQSLDDLASNVAVYREARARSGRAPGGPGVTVMLHTYLEEDADSARRVAREPFVGYLRSAVKVFESFLGTYGPASARPAELDEDDLQYLLSVAYERYIETSALIGSPRTARPVLERLAEIGVEEVACFVDFGLDPGRMLAGVERISELAGDPGSAASGRGGRTGPAASLALCDPAGLDTLASEEGGGRAARLRAVLLDDWAGDGPLREAVAVPVCRASELWGEPVRKEEW